MVSRANKSEMDRKERVSATFKRRREKAYKAEKAENHGGPMKTAPQKKSKDNPGSLFSRNSVGGKVIANKNKRK